MSELTDILAGLGAKLDGLDLTDTEREVFGAILRAASDDDDADGVEGFGGTILYRSIMPRVFGNLISIGPADDDTRGVVSPVASSGGADAEPVEPTRSQV